MDDIEKELRVTREVAQHLAESLRYAMGCLRDHDDLMHIVMTPSSQITVGMLVRGALARYDALVKDTDACR